jgi:hypothetical protein
MYAYVSIDAIGVALAVAATGGRRRAGGISLQGWTPRGKRTYWLLDGTSRYTMPATELRMRGKSVQAKLVVEFECSGEGCLNFFRQKIASSFLRQSDGTTILFSPLPCCMPPL